MNTNTRQYFPQFIGEPYQPDFSLFTENIRTGRYVLQRGRLVYVDREFCAILGWENPQELIGRSLWRLVHPKDRVLVRLSRNRNGQEVGTPEPFRMFQANGLTVWVAMQGGNTTLNAKPANFGCLIDMTPIRSLTRSLKRYQDRITQVEDAVAEVYLKGNILSYTEAARKLWGVSCADIIGKNYREFMDENSARTVRHAYQRVYKTGQPGNQVIYEIIRQLDGERMTVEDSVVLMRDNNGQPAGFRTVSRDITAQKAVERQAHEQQAQLEAIFQSVNDAIITVDPAVHITNANAAAKAICGIDIQNATDLPLAAHQQQCSAACGDVLRRTLEARRSIKDFRIECRHELRQRQIVDVSSAALFDPQEKYLGAVLVIRDVTRQQDLQRALNPRHHFLHLIGKSRVMRDIYHLLEDLADLQTTVLITGESGTGKNMIAKALHQSGLRAAQPFVTVNCSALAENLLESELFGHTKGAFTGAVQDKQGRFEAAGQGTLLLDEIGDISPLIQLKLLRVIQEKEFERVGETTSRKLNARVIACTHQNLQDKVKLGEFREDLYYRLKVVEIHISPLRERMEDIPLLIEHFRQFYNQRFGKNIEGLSTQAMARIMNYSWPGNVRELEHVIERAFVLCDAAFITPAYLPAEVKNFKKTKNPSSSDEIDGTEVSHPQTLLDALNQTFWNRSKTAQLLGISRQTLYRKIKEHQIGRKPK